MVTSKCAYQNVNIHTSKVFVILGTIKGSFFLLVKKPYCLTINIQRSVFFITQIFLFHLYVSVFRHTSIISIFTICPDKYAVKILLPALQ